jgi:hypothetical protein
MNFSLPHFLFALIVAAVLGLGMGKGEAQQGKRVALWGGPRNLLVYPNTFTNSAWTLVRGITVTPGIADPVGGTAASTLSSTTETLAQVYQLYPTTTGLSYVSTLWLRRRTGTGTIYLYGADENPYVVTLTANWVKYKVVKLATGASGLFDVNIATIGDQVDAYMANVYAGTQ